MNLYFIFNKVHCKTSHSFLYSLCSLMTNVVMVRSNKYNQINSVINISNSSKTYLVNTFFNMIDSLNIEINMQDVSSRGSENTSEGASTNQMDGHCPLVVKSCLIVIFYDFSFLPEPLMRNFLFYCTWFCFS